jgi:hypothetical protein
MLGSISLRDPIMRDGVKAEEKAERVWDCADAIHSKTTFTQCLLFSDTNPL